MPDESREVKAQLLCALFTVIAYLNKNTVDGYDIRVMKNIFKVILFGAFLSTTVALADSDSKLDPGVFDTVLPGGLTISQTLEDWDNSAMRYRNEPPEVDEALPSKAQDQSAKDSSEQSPNVRLIRLAFR